ncbi:MAG: hypothetical protein ACI4QL_02840 [Candidatus Fimimonas sp.]
MKSTKNCTNNAKGCTGKGATKTSNNSNSKKSQKSAKSSQESDTDPSGSYTGNPVGWGKNARPEQDADDL